jgi:shikimate dehydrogenase
MTRLVALIGKPLKRRHSQVMHDAAFDACGIDARYVLREVDAEEVPGIVADAHGEDWLGLGVTAPYKRDVVRLVDRVDGDAFLMDAVNNVERADDGRLIGFNTDAPGFVVGVERAMGRSLADADVVVAGAGGAANAVVFGCLRRGVRSITIGNRTWLPAAALADRYSGIFPSPPVATELGDAMFVEAIRHADLAVNATTVGMIDPGMTIPVDDLPDHATVFDLVYVPAETPLLAAARDRGLRAANGSEMLIAQAAAAFERWTGVSGMDDVMRAAVAPLLADSTVTA